ncbi:hypothetical protein OF829_00610 [Sphingomonas sp. LB-2]|uniref:hypothetical protein n=1 Tax=Sphingomonas caeni TaxID=2984949 RepID=UPI00222E2660|nr:hypothetical protein [Sphingomonas caeni]MCW3845722.1 hypothetical protein [Sphingomonas caeni]
MKRALIALVAGTVLSGLAAAYAATVPHLASSDEAQPSQPAPAKAKPSKLAATD